MIRNGPVVQRYSTLFDDTADVPYGLGCGGTIDLLFEPTGTLEAAALLSAIEASLSGTASTVLTQLPEAGQALGPRTRGRNADCNQTGKDHLLSNRIHCLHWSPPGLRPIGLSQSVCSPTSRHLKVPAARSGSCSRQTSTAVP